MFSGNVVLLPDLLVSRVFETRVSANRPHPRTPSNSLSTLDCSFSPPRPGTVRRVEKPLDSLVLSSPLPERAFLCLPSPCPHLMLIQLPHWIPPFPPSFFLNVIVPRHLVIPLPFHIEPNKCFRDRYGSIVLNQSVETRSTLAARRVDAF